MIINFILNGEDINLEVNPWERLSSLLRSEFKLFGTQEDCCKGFCGKCIIIFSGKPANACLIPAFKVNNSEIVTIEGFIKTEEYRDIQSGFKKTGYESCAFCESARILITSNLLDDEPRPTDAMILERMSSISCRCSQPSMIISAVKAAAKLRERRIFGYVSS